MSEIKAQNARVRIQMAQDQADPVGTTIDYYENDGAGGAVDYVNRINSADIEMWPANAAGKIGFGIGLMGAGLFGFGEGGAGFGDGLFGGGLFGYGANPIKVDDADGFLTEQHLDGPWIFGSKTIDPAGNESTATEETITLKGTPKPPTNLATVDYVAGVLTFNYDLSVDDN